MTFADDDLMTLAEACEILFRNAITPSTLRAEVRRGNLRIERIGRKDFVTRAAIKEMRERCVVDQGPRAHVSGSSRGGSVADAPMSRQSGSSATTADTKEALAAARLTAKRLKESSRNISRKSDSRRSAEVIPLSS